MTGIWQQFGGFVQVGENLSDQRMAEFHDAGGRWLVVLLYGDDASGPWNAANIETLKTRAHAHGLAVGGWFNVFGEDADDAANAINLLARQHNLALVMLDCEDAYQGAGAEKLPELLREVRARLATWPLGVSPKAVDDSMIWNGRGVTPQRSCYYQRVRVCPQWYSGQYLKDLGHGPEAQMQFLQAEQPGNINFADPAGPSGRSVPLSYVHPVLEATGLEGSNLVDELARVAICKRYGFTYGLSVYNMENLSAADLASLAGERGRLFLT